MAAEDTVEWAPLYVMGAGYKKLNGAYVGAGVYEDSPRYKNPNQPIWVFNVPEKECWIFGNKARFLEDQTKMMYKCKQNFEGGDPIPTHGWKKGQPPGAGKPPKLICTAFTENEDVFIWSKKQKKWVEGTVKTVDGKKYKVNIKGKKTRKPLTIPRPQLRSAGDTKFTVKQFVEVRTKKGDWIPALVGDLKGDDKYSIILPEGKAVTFPEARIRPSEMCRDGDEEEAPAPEAAAPKAAATTSAASIQAPAASGGASNEEVVALRAHVAELESALETAVAQAAAAASAAVAPGTSAPAASGGGLDMSIANQIKDKQAQMLGLIEEIMMLQQQLGF